MVYCLYFTIYIIRKVHIYSQRCQRVLPIIEDYRSNYNGVLMTGVQLWEMSVIPTLLNNAGTWTNIDQISLKKLNNLQNTLLRYLLSTPRSTPSPSLAWDFGVLPMKYRIMIKKLCLIKHIVSLEDGCLAKEICDAQLKFTFPGLATECKIIIRELNLPDITINQINAKYSKLMWKNLVQKRSQKNMQK